jgi:hypothetical protein
MTYAYETMAKRDKGIEKLKRNFEYRNPDAKFNDSCSWIITGKSTNGEEIEIKSTGVRIQ